MTRTLPMAVTGYGVVSPLGVGREAFAATFADSTRTACEAIGVPTVFDPERVPNARAAEVWNFDAKEHLGEKGLRSPWAAPTRPA